MCARVITSECAHACEVCAGALWMSLRACVHSGVLACVRACVRALSVCACVRAFERICAREHAAAATAAAGAQATNARGRAHGRKRSASDERAGPASDERAMKEQPAAVTAAGEPMVASPRRAGHGPARRSSPPTPFFSSPRRAGHGRPPAAAVAAQGGRGGVQEDTHLPPLRRRPRAPPCPRDPAQRAVLDARPFARCVGDAAHGPTQRLADARLAGPCRARPAQDAVSRAPSMPHAHPDAGTARSSFAHSDVGGADAAGASTATAAQVAERRKSGPLSACGRGRSRGVGPTASPAGKRG